MKKCAILIVNGFDRRNRWGIYQAEEAKAYPWIEVCLRQVQRHSRDSSYDVFVYDNACILRHRRIMAKHSQVKVYPGLISFIMSNIVRCSFPGRTSCCLDELGHPLALDLLVRRLSADYEFFITLDTDAFPVQDGWIEFLTSAIEQGSMIAGVYRNEMSEVLTPFIHVSCLCMRVCDFLDLPISFSKQMTTDVGQNITLALYDRGGKMGCLERTNRINHHFLMAGIYGNLIYHQGAGSRRAYFWSAEKSSTSIREEEEQLRVKLRDRVFQRLESHIEEILGAPYGQLPSPTMRVLEEDRYPVRS